MTVIFQPEGNLSGSTAGFGVFWIGQTSMSEEEYQ